MSRILTVAAAQLGPVQRDDSREQVVERMIALLHQARRHGVELVVYPELALTTFFPRWFVDDITEADHWYERSMPNAATQPLFDEARRLGIGFCIGYALLDDDGHRWNVQTLVERDGSIVASYTKTHIPGHEHNEPDRPFQHAERYYFEPSPDGFGVWRAFGGLMGMMICNDRRWPESYRVMGLQGVEMILCGYNTPIHYVPDPSQDILQGFHNALGHAERCIPERHLGGGRRQRWRRGRGRLVGAVDDHRSQRTDRCPGGDSGRRVGVARCDLDWCKRYKGTLFDFDRYRRPEVYGRITASARRGRAGLMGSITPGLVCGHHHLYSALARGMPAPPKQPTNFIEILEQVWWRLDVALDEEMIRWSAMLGAVEALMCGTTGIIDHHEGPSAIDGSLSIIADACAEVGVRVNCAYGVTDRHGSLRRRGTRRERAVPPRRRARDGRCSRRLHMQGRDIGSGRAGWRPTSASACTSTSPKVLPTAMPEPASNRLPPTIGCSSTAFISIGRCPAPSPTIRDRT